MKKKLLVVLSLFFFSLSFIGCVSETTTTTTSTTTTTTTTTTTEATTLSTMEEPTVESGYLVDYPQDGTILHAWNWSMETIEAHLQEIAIAGFSTIQISPMQPQKDYYGIASWQGNWWKLYQPLGFSVATGNHSLGTKADLESLCEAADAYGINIIVDIVANHLAGGDNITLNAGVAAYEPEIYNQELIHTLVGYASDISVYKVTQFPLGGYPDLATENPIVQERVLSLLKEYVDVGVDGFRFDAAKHIETPSDGEYASNFWPYVIDGVKDYAEGLGIDDLFIYGEILNTPGTGRSFADYMPYMGVTSNGMSAQILSAVTSKNAYKLVTATYLADVGPSKSVLWAESHDTYANDSHTTTYISDANITKAYVIAASRKDATTLYFARPSDTTFMGEIGSYLWQSIEVSTINKFHNYFAGSDEAYTIQSGFFLNERFNSLTSGLVIADVNGTGSVSNLTVSHLSDGTYTDQISGTAFEVVDGMISGTVGESGVAVIMPAVYQPLPVLYVSNDGLHTEFPDTLTIEVYSYHTTEAYYSMNGGAQVPFSGNFELVLSHPDDNAIITLDFELWNGDYMIEEHYEYIKNNLVITEVVVNDIDQEIVGSNKVVAWVWAQGSEGRWKEGVYDNGTFTFDKDANMDYFLLVTFSSETVSYSWPSVLWQTNDVEIPYDGIYDGSTLIWREYGN